jgi:hypothetical protein
MAKQSFNVICPTPTTLLQGVKKRGEMGSATHLPQYEMYDYC